MGNSFKLKMKEIKFFLPGIIGLNLFVMIVINGFRTYYSGQSEIENTRQELVKNIKHDLDSYLSVEIRNLKVASEVLLNDEKTLQLFSWQDRKMLSDHLLPIYEKKLKPEFGIKQFQFHLPPATSFLRLHKVQKYGDDLSSFRKTVVEANNTHKIVSGLEVGVGGLGVRMVHPVKYEGNYIGTLEFGTAYKEILNELAKRYHATFAIGVYDKVFKAANRSENTSNDIVVDNIVYYDYSNNDIKNNLKNIDATQEITTFSDNGNDMLAVSVPINDYSGSEIGHASFLVDETAIVSKLQNDIIIGIIFPMVMVIIVMYLLVLVINKRLIKPIDELIFFTDELTNGNLNAKQPQFYFSALQKFSIAMDKLRDKIDQQYQMLDNLPTPVMNIDKEFNIQYMNRIGASIVGSDQESLVGQKCYDYIKTGHCNTENCATAKAMQQNKHVSAETVANPNNSKMDIKYTGVPITNKFGEVVSAIEFVADVTDIKSEYKYLERSTNVLIEAMNNFAAGDLTVKVKSEREKGEIFDLFQGFNIAVNNFKDLIEQLMGAVEATASASTQISSSAEEMAAGAQEQSAQTAEVAAAMEEMSRTVVETASNATSAAESSNESSEKAKEGAVKLDDSKVGMQRIVNSTESVGTKISSLTSKTEQIGEIAQVIDDIADQTNLLALNAAIEAARAGEHGRGFAVVADEVRKLAENTTKATKEIADTIRAIQQEGEEAGISMKEADAAVNDGMKLNEEVGDVLSSILSSAENVSIQISQVAAASEEQSATAEQVSSNIESINNVANESAAGVQQIAAASEDLNRLTENLSRLVEQFKIDDKANFAVRQNGKIVED